MQQFKISEISELLKIPHTKCKRYTREFLGPDPEATIQSGYARLLNMQEAYAVYLGAHLVSILKFTVHEAKIIIEDLKPWLVDFGLFPGDDNNFQETKSEVESWKVIVYRTDKPYFFDFEAKGIISSIISGHIKVGPYKNAPITTDKYVSIPHMDSDPARPQAYYRDFNKIMILRISYLKEVFMLQIERKNPAEHMRNLVKHLVV